MLCILQVSGEMLLPPGSPFPNLLIPVGSTLVQGTPTSWRAATFGSFLVFSQECELGEESNHLLHMTIASAPNTMPGTHRCSVILWPVVSLSPPSDTRSHWWAARPVMGHLISTQGTQHRSTGGSRKGLKVRKATRQKKKKKFGVGNLQLSIIVTKMAGRRLKTNFHRGRK